MQQDKFLICRVLSTKPNSLDYVVFNEADVSRRKDVEVVSKSFTTEAEAIAVINQLGGTIPEAPAIFLDHFEEDFKTVWCWKDERTMASSQTFTSKREALNAWNTDKLVFDSLEC